MPATSMLAHVGEQHRDVLLVAQHPPDRRGDVARRQRRRRDLVQQRLEEMVVVAVDQRDADRRARERPRRVEAAEAAADDHDVWKRSRSVHVLVRVQSVAVRRVRGSVPVGVRCYRKSHGPSVVSRAQRPARRAGVGRRNRLPARLS